MKLRLTSVLFVLSHLIVIADADERPNIVFFLTDDQSTFSVGAYGNDDVQTPNMDALARDGMVFDNHYVTTAICMASRANIMTGKFEFRTGCNFMHGTMALLRKHWKRSYPVLLRRAGYFVAMAGKIGFKVADRADEWGHVPENDFDKWGASDGQTSYLTEENESMKAYAEKYPHSTRAYGAFGADFVEEAVAVNKPFCLSISFKAPHRPPYPDPLDDEVYKGKKFTKPGNFGRQAGEHFAEQARQGRQYLQFFDEWGYDTRYDNVMAKYHQQVYAVDVAIGMVRDALEKHGVANNTVIIFSSDNGYFSGSHGFGGKVLPYEEASRVPLIMYDPRHNNSGKQLRCKSLTGNVDFAPTLMDLAGVKHPKGMDGKSLLPLYDNPSNTTHKALPLINVWGPGQVHSLGVVTKFNKYIHWPWAGDGLKPSEELYRKRKDPLELNNLILNYTGNELKSMRNIHDKFVRRWKRGAVPYHNYRPFGVFFDRTASWETKLEEFRNNEKNREAECRGRPACF